MQRRKSRTVETVERHGALVRLQHWAIALSGIVLLFSGFGQFPLYKRYMVDRLPGFAWTSNFGLQFDIHLAAAMVFSAAVAFHLVHHLMRRETALMPRRGDLGESWQIIKASFGSGEEPPSGKYLAEQRIVYAFFGVVILVLTVTGLVKIAKNLPGISLSPAMLMAATMLHNLATVLFLATLGAHVAALLLKVNRPLLRGMFTGRVSAAYARRRHPLWAASSQETTEQGSDAEPPLEGAEAPPAGGEGLEAA